MIVDVRKPLFAWDEMHASPSLATIRQALEAIPDAPLLTALQARRHRGCDRYPVRVLWGVLLLAILLRHPTTEACLEELRRNAPSDSSSASRPRTPSRTAGTGPASSPSSVSPNT